MAGVRLPSSNSSVFSSYETGLSAGVHLDVSCTALRTDSRDWPCRAAVKTKVHSRPQNHFLAIFLSAWGVRHLLLTIAVAPRPITPDFFPVFLRSSYRLEILCTILHLRRETRQSPGGFQAFGQAFRLEGY